MELRAKMNDDAQIPRFFVEGQPVDLTCVDVSEVRDQALVVQQPNRTSIPDGRRQEPAYDFNGGEDSVFATSASVPLLRARVNPRIERVQSAPTLMEHEVGLALRTISDEFNDSFIQPRNANQSRRASHPNTNNHHSPGIIESLRRQLSRRSWTNSQSSSESTSEHRASQRTSAQSVPEEDEEEQ